MEDTNDIYLSQIICLECMLKEGFLIINFFFDVIFDKQENELQ